eukprot:TRINITY_DN1313_c0_g1_i4.p1 TRINITY_DN1313_c0_g1~~TRINITY_DN1313_c0_g1_i4.p1  ORF type:complete len:451 (+),score=71.29 TRINITY_DN1313_c0_g1_i4:84-1355(+)
MRGERAGALALAAVTAAALGLPLAEAKGSAAGTRSGTYSGRAIGGGSRDGANRAFLYRGPYYVGGRTYAPAYGSYPNAPGFSGDANGTCGNGTCPCPVPDEGNTRIWVYVQFKLPNRLCNGGTCTVQSVYDVTTFEVDAFLDIASRVPCTPPTQVLVLRLCTLTNPALVAGGLADDQLLNPATCTIVGDEVSVHYQARARRLLQTEHHVVQFVVGAESKAHGDALHPHIKAALSPRSRLSQIYNISHGAVLSVETQESVSEFPGWAIAVIVVCGAYCLCCAWFIWKGRHNFVRPECCRDKCSGKASAPPPGVRRGSSAGPQNMPPPDFYSAPESNKSFALDAAQRRRLQEVGMIESEDEDSERSPISRDSGDSNMDERRVPSGSSRSRCPPPDPIADDPIGLPIKKCWGKETGAGKGPVTMEP